LFHLVFGVCLFAAFRRDEREPAEIKSPDYNHGKFRNSERIPMKRLSRAEIKEGLKSVPIETVLLGSIGAKEKSLTAKQKEFARQIALGETKAGAYRKSRETKAKPASASREGQELMKNPAIVSQVEAYKVALEAQKFATPAHLRALTIHKLIEGALDPEMPPAQRVKCLELLGKITEVALFTERRETVVTHNSEKIREKLLASIRLAIKSEATDVDISGDDLLAELGGGADAEIVESAPYHLATPQKNLDTPTALSHTIPHNGSISELAHQLSDSGSATKEENLDSEVDTNLTCTGVTSDKPL